MKQQPNVAHWFVADQLAPERDTWYRAMRRHTPNTEIHTYYADIFPGKHGNLAHVHNWALNKAREFEIELLVFLQDFIWLPQGAIKKFQIAAKNHPFDLLTGNVVSSPGWEVDASKSEHQRLYSIFDSGGIGTQPPGPYTPDTRDQMGWWQNDVATGKYLSQHAWEINWGAMPYALINAGVDFDEDFDHGTQWENTDFAHQIKAAFSNPNTIQPPGTTLGGSVWWDYYNKAYALPHREYFPKTHEGEREVDNGLRFRQKWGNV